VHHIAKKVKKNKFMIYLIFLLIVVANECPTKESPTKESPTNEGLAKESLTKESRTNE
jgi:hypothetical protein